MLSGLRASSRTIGFQLAFWYSAIFIASSLILFFVTFFSLKFSFRQNDRKLIQSEMEDYVADFRMGGSSRLERALSEIRFKDSTGQDLFFVRLTDAKKGTVFLSIPRQWPAPDLERLDTGQTENKGPWSSISSNGVKNTYEILSKPITPGLILQVGKLTVNSQELIARFRAIFLKILIPVFITGFAGGMLLTFRALRPIRYLINATRQIIGTGEINARVPVGDSKDELQELSRLFNTMLEKIEKLIKGMREGLDNVAHDLRTPITRIRAGAEMALRSEASPDTLKSALADSIEEADRILTMLNTVMDISEAETGAMLLNLQDVDLPALINEVTDLYSYVAEEKNVAIRASFTGNMQVLADKNRIQQAIANLLDNAVKYTDCGGSVEIQTSRENQSAVIQITDTGAGIQPQDLPKIWDRLYRGDKSRSQRGLGLGLSLVKAIILAHKGRVEVSSAPGEGSVFTVYIPANPKTDNIADL